MIINKKEGFLVNKNETVDSFIKTLLMQEKSIRPYHAGNTPAITILNNNSFNCKVRNVVPNLYSKSFVSSNITNIKMSDIISGKFIEENYNIIEVNYQIDDSKAYYEETYVIGEYTVELRDDNICERIIELNKTNGLLINLFIAIFLINAGEHIELTNGFYSAVYRNNPTSVLICHNFITKLVENVENDIIISDSLYNTMVSWLVDDRSYLVFNLLFKLSDTRKLMMDIFKSKIDHLFTNQKFNSPEFEMTNEELAELIKVYKKLKYNISGHMRYMNKTTCVPLSKLYTSMERNTTNDLTDEVLQLFYELLLNSSSYNYILTNLFNSNNQLDKSLLYNNVTRTNKFIRAFGLEELNKLKGVVVRKDISKIMSLFTNAGSNAEFYFPAVILKMDSLTEQEISDNSLILTDTILGKISANYSYTMRLDLSDILVNTDNLEKNLIPLIVESLNNLKGSSLSSRYKIIASNSKTSTDSIYALINLYISANLTKYPKFSKLYMELAI